MAVYFIRAGYDGPVKIGHADDVAYRMAAFQTGNHERLMLLRVVDGSAVFERRLHYHFATHRQLGEWFTFHPDMLTVEPAHLPNPPRPRPTAVAVKPAATGANVSAVFDAFDGPTNLARALGVPMTTVHNWKRTGRIPAWRMSEIEALQQRKAA